MAAKSPQPTLRLVWNPDFLRLMEEIKTFPDRLVFVSEPTKGAV